MLGGWEGFRMGGRQAAERPAHCATSRTPQRAFGHTSEASDWSPQCIVSVRLPFVVAVGAPNAAEQEHVVVSETGQPHRTEAPPVLEVLSAAYANRSNVLVPERNTRD